MKNIKQDQEIVKNTLEYIEFATQDYRDTPNKMFTVIKQIITSLDKNLNLPKSYSDERLDGFLCAILPSYRLKKEAERDAKRAIDISKKASDFMSSVFENRVAA